MGICMASVVLVWLLSYLYGVMARGGMSFTDFAVVDQGMWWVSQQDTMYNHSTNLLQQLGMNPP